MTLSFDILFPLIIGAAAGGIINGLAGFGTALLSLGIWLQVLPPSQAVPVVVVMSVVSGLQGVWIVREEIKVAKRRLAAFLLPALVGVPLGTVALGFISATLLKLTISAFMILYGVFFAFRRSLPRLERPTPLADALVGFIGGILGGAASLSGALPTMWCAMRPWTKGETRAVLQPFNVVILVIAAALYAWQGYYTRHTLALIAVALPVTIVSAQMGILVFHRLTDEQFRRTLIWVLLLSGILLALREVT